MGQIRPREPGAERARTALLDRPRIVPILLVAEVQPAARDPQLAVARDPGREHRVEQVDAPVDRVEQVERRAEAHQVARPRVAIEERHRGVERRVALAPGVSSPARPPMLMPSNGSAGDEPRRLRAQPGSSPPWTIAEQRLVGARVGGERALRPAVRPVASRPRTTGRGELGNTGWSKATAMSGPSASWTAIECSGVNRWIDPSRWT